ncbi:LOW QUALITY PROTEIN: probable carboxylesterase 18 [Diospyros lotus]|uniref:LOW QUALITY PROTEIN: probable carboxylesterase 18 n=1 Tax=Diospyros lotus TaxID=55363 RepID=UPI0022505D4A|nr:LOW QUALITY PROTEIN: probable carboxylesterase 18 [Diospyros lotus]
MAEARSETKESKFGEKAAAKAAALPWKTRVSLFVMSMVTDAARRRDGSVNRRLMNFLDFKSPPNPTKPIRSVRTFDLTVDPHRKLWFRVFVPSDAHNSSPLPVMVFFHGGGFVFLSANNMAYDPVCRRFARRVPAIVVSVNYRLAPEHRYPAQYEDGFDVLKFLDQQQNELPETADLSQCFLIGDSAGANLAHHVAKRAAESNFRQLKVVGLVAIQPFFGGEERTEPEKRLTQLVTMERTDWMWKAFMGPNYEGRDHESINVSGPRAADIAAVEGFPATVVVVGGLDGLQEWQRRYYRWLKASGKEAHLLEYPNSVHAFYIFPELPESAHLTSQVADFIHAHSSASASSMAA